MSRRRSHVASVVAGGVVIAAGFAVAIVEVLKLPRGSIWIVVASAVAVVAAIRVLSKRRG